MTPERLGSFEIRGLLGEGGSAVVYASELGGTPVAIKVLHPDLSLDEKQVVRFLEEADRLRRVEHPCLVRVLSAGSLPDGRPYIVMPLLSGRSLAAQLELGPLPIDEALALFDGVAGAVAAVHAAGLVHRDIKPENVMFLAPAAEGGERRLVLLDLGIARDTDGGPSTTTKAGFVRGTPAYMSPERLFGQPASVRTDVYELALLLYMMLTARLPWDEGDPAGRLSPKLRPEDSARVPPPIATVLFDALSAEVSRRYESADELAARVRLSAVSWRRSLATPARASAWPAQAAAARTFEIDQPTPLATALPQRSAAAPKRSLLPWLATFALGGAVAAGAVLAVPRLSGDGAQVAVSTADSSRDAVVAPSPEASVAEPSASVPPPPDLGPSASAVISASASGSAAAPAPIKEGTIDASAVHARVSARMSTISKCAREEAKRADFSGGRVNLSFWIGLDGSVTAIRSTSSTFPSDVTQCIVGHVRAIKFPKPQGGPVNAIMPIVLTPAAPAASASAQP